MSEVETFYYAICKHTGSSRKWHELDPMQQHQFIQALNIILQITSSVG